MFGSRLAGRGKLSARVGVTKRRRKKVARSPGTSRIYTSAPPLPRLRRGSYQSALKRVNQIGCVVALFSACALCSSGCIGDSDTPGTLVVALDSDPQSLDPRFGADATSARVADLLHMALTRADGAGGRVPELARSWEWLDDRTLRF